MAEAKKKRRVVKKSETVRDRAAKAQVATPKKRRIHRKAASAASRPARAVGRGVKKSVKPLSPLLKPFKTKPARAIGRALASILFLRYFRESWHELRKVTWPTRRETYKLTLAVFVFAVSFGLLIALVDFGLDKVFKQLLT